MLVKVLVFGGGCLCVGEGTCVWRGCACVLVKVLVFGGVCLCVLMMVKVGGGVPVCVDDGKGRRGCACVC